MNGLAFKLLRNFLLPFLTTSSIITFIGTFFLSSASLYPIFFNLKTGIFLALLSLMVFICLLLSSSLKNSIIAISKKLFFVIISVEFFLYSLKIFNYETTFISSYILFIVTVTCFLGAIIISTNNTFTGGKGLKISNGANAVLEKSNFYFYVLTFCFIFIKIIMPLIYPGNYMDESYQILSGVEVFENGNFPELYVNEPYTRGSYISALVGFAMFIFGKSIFVAKLVPAIFGIINYFLLFYLCQKLQINKQYTLLTLICFTFIPWFIFNHFYIRMYVFYEFLILFLTILFILLIQNITNFKKLLTISIIIFATLISSLLFSNDFGIYMVFVYVSIYFLYIYIFEFKNIPISNRYFILFNKKPLWKTMFLVVSVTLGFCLINGFLILFRIIYGDLEYTSSNDLKFNYLFFETNLVFTQLLIMSLAIVFVKKVNIYIKLVIVSTFVILFIHFIFPSDFQLLRTVIYILPLYYLVAVIVLSNLLPKFNSPSAKYILILFFLFSIVANYPKGFLLRPYIPSEVGYIDNRIYKDASRICSDSVNITAGYPGMVIFHGLKPDYFLNIEILKSPNTYLTDDYIKYTEVYTKIPVVTTYEEFVYIVKSNQKVCFTGGELSRRNIGPEILDYVNKNMTKVENQYLENLNGEPLFFTKP